jgi:hypothetical protein
MSDLPIGRVRRTAGNILIFLGGLALIASAATKFTHVVPVVKQLAAIGFDGGRLMIIATLEVFSAAMFLIPRTRSIGLLLISSYMGGAIAAHLGHGEPVYQPAFVLALLWIGAYLRHPEVLWSLKLSTGTGSQVAKQASQQTALRQI